MDKPSKNKPASARYALLDELRGLDLISMMLYHACWDLMFLFDIWMDWYIGWPGRLWQQSICWVFILLSGFCVPLGHRTLKRGAQVFAAGALVTVVTLVFMPEDRVVFGVLTFLGSAMLLTGVLEPLLKKIPPAAGLAVSAVLFALTYHLDERWLGFGWWIRRVEGASRLFDAIRIDHFRAFERYWSVPAGAETAKEGQWEPGPGMDLLRVLTGWFPHITYIAEDLGLLTPEVHQLREAAGLPGMKVLEFAFSDPGNDYLSHNYGSRRCVCYTGTHDNDTALGWYDHAGEAERAFAERYLGASGRENVRQALLRCGMGSTAELFVAQMQDYLALGSEGRINVPGVAAGNWRWRMAPGAAAAGLAADIRRLTEVYGR